MRAIALARELEAAGHKVILRTHYRGEVLLDIWPEKAKIGHREHAWHGVHGMIFLDADGSALADPPAGASFNSFRFQIGDENLSFEEAAALLASTAQRPVQTAALEGQIN
jgi:hypothetical protein